jgi:hypothetical protein
MARRYVQRVGIRWGILVDMDTGTVGKKLLWEIKLASDDARRLCELGDNGNADGERDDVRWGQASQQENCGLGCSGCVARPLRAFNALASCDSCCIDGPEKWGDPLAGLGVSLEEPRFIRTVHVEELLGDD